jgi:NADP-dependent 3-hydroxy acid dehydrogenase YdfG
MYDIYTLVFLYFRTGASAGIGAACAQEFARSGSNVIISARRIDRLNALKSQILSECPAVKVLPVAMDVRDRSSVRYSLLLIIKR